VLLNKCIVKLFLKVSMSVTFSSSAGKLLQALRRLTCDLKVKVATGMVITFYFSVSFNALLVQPD